jgi:hypothetical protein
MEIFMKMQVSNEYLVGSWNVSSRVTNSLSAASRRARIYLVSTNEESESVDISNFEIAPKKPTHKNMHIHKLAIVACPESHIM